MKKLLKYFKDYRSQSVLAPFFKLFEVCFELVVPLVMARIIDVGIKNSDTACVLRMGGILALLGVAGLICSITAQYFAAKAAAGFGTALRDDLFAHMNRLSCDALDKAGSAALITRITVDVNQVQTGVNLSLRLLLRSPFVVFGSVAMAFTIHMRAAMIFVLIIPLLSAVVFGIMFFTMPVYKKVQSRLDRVLLTVRENLSGLRVIRAFNRQEGEKQKFVCENDTLAKLQVFAGKISALLNPLTFMMINIAVVVLLYTGAFEVDAGSVTGGELVALINYMSQILVELIKLANLIITISRSLASASRISAVFELEEGIKENAVPVRKIESRFAVEFKSVEFSYEGAREPALRDITFSLKKGETLGIIGGTGSGKTTLVDMIPRFYDAAKGAVLVDGRDVKEYPVKKLREKIGMAPQKAALFHGTVRENIKWGDFNATDDEIFRSLQIAQAADFIEEKGKGLDFYIQAHGKNLSGGQKQRLAIARALVRKPEILIMDDSTSALDLATDARLRKALKENFSGRTVITVSCRVSAVRGADKIIVLDDGGMAGIGTHDELLAKCQVYREICLSQLHGSGGGFL